MRRPGFGSLPSALFLLLFLFPLFTPKAAAFGNLTFRYQHFLFTIDPDSHPEWHGTEEQWTYNGQPIRPSAAWRMDGDDVPPLPAGIARTQRVAWDPLTIRSALETQISSKFDREASAVTISRSTGGTIGFKGVGLNGRHIDLEAAAALTIAALERGATDILLPVTETQPQITVTDPELRAQGIKEVVTVGESSYAGSPPNRLHNIAVGLSKFNGHLIPKGTTFSFDQTLGLVDGSTGYLKELVIKGDKTEPDYGGGLCQVSSTAYRGVWEYGFPIPQRRNHSYNVSYYGPPGTDATVYQPFPDMQFTNDSPGALLMQTYQQDGHAYFIYYGTKDARTAEVWGPITLGTKAAPPDRTLYTTALAPGQKRKVGDRHAGLTVVWYRSIRSATGASIQERVLSVYEARPLFYEVGIAAAEAPPVDVNTTEPPRVF